MSDYLQKAWDALIGSIRLDTIVRIDVTAEHRETGATEGGVLALYQPNGRSVR